MERFEHFTITTIKRKRGFLEIYGHKRKELLEQLESRILAFQPDIRKKSELQPPSIEFDTIYLALSDASKKYHRCVVVEKKLRNKVVIELIDFGRDFEVNQSCLLELSENDEMSKFLRELPPIATKYFLCGFYCSWRNNEFPVLETLLINSTFIILNEQTDRECRYISLEFDGRDLTDRLTSDSIGIAISFTEQRIEVRRAFQRAIDVDEQMYQSRSPVKRLPARRNLIPNRPLQSVINNNVITDQGKRLIEGHIGMNIQQQHQRLPRLDLSQTDGASSSVSATQMPAFIANDLSMDAFHVVYCSYIEDGPSLFSVQLKNHEHILDKMTFDIANAPRNPITTKMMIGMACLARYSEDKSLYRAVIQKILASGCRVTFIDYGNSEFVQFADIFEIPQKFLEHKIFSIPFQLAGIKQLQPIDQRLNEYFKTKFTKRELELKVVPSDNPQIQQCQLFFQAKSVLEMLLAKQAQCYTFSAPPDLNDGENVIIRFALTAKQFYLQRSIDTNEFDIMMDALFNSCIKISPMKNLPIEGKCCAVMYKDNTECYRAIVTKKLDNRSVGVRLVDYGFHINCGLNQLREMDTSFFELPQQAIECCLIDFETVSDVSTTTGQQITMLIEDKEGKTNQFRVSVRRRMENGVYLVDLRDEINNLNVSSSIYKHAMPRKFPNTRKDTEKSSTEKGVQQPKQQNIVRNQEKPTQMALDHNKRNGDVNRLEIEKTIKNINNNRRVDGNKNYIECTVADTSGLHSSDIGRTTECADVVEYATKPVAKCVLVGFNPVLPEQLPIPKNSTIGVHITHWDTPFNFHVQWRSLETNRTEMMDQMQQFYANQRPVQQRPPIGSLVVVQHKDSQEFNRGKIIDYNEARNKYKVKAIDIGDVIIYQQTELFETEQSFIRLAPMAICCTLGNVIMTKTKAEILEKIEFTIKQANSSNQIECEFDKTDDEIKQAEILINGESLKELLIKNQLILQIPKNVCLERLIGQKVMLHTTDATDLTRFQAKLLGCDILYMFSYKDVGLVKKNERLNEEFRAHIKANKCVKAQIELIDAENIIHVSIYLPSLDKDIDEGEIVGFPVFNDEFKCEITHFEVPHIFYVQNVDNINILDKILEEVEVNFQTSNALQEAPKLGELYIGISNLDEIPYRGKIEKLCDNGSALVRWIDYGNCEYVPLERITELRKDLKLMSALAIKVFAPIEITDANVSQDIFDYVNKRLSEETKATILDIHKSNLIVEIKINDEDLYAPFESNEKIRRLNVKEFIKNFEQNQLKPLKQDDAPKIVTENEIQERPVNEIEKEVRAETISAMPVRIEPIQTEPVYTEPIRADPPSTPAIKETQLTNVQQSVGEANASVKLTEAFIAHVDHPNQFYLQLESDSDEIAELEQSLQIVASQLPPLMNFHRGHLCIAKYTYYDLWYRAKIIDSDGETTSIHFIDYGNTDTITDNSLLKSSNDSINDKKPLAMLCSLPVEPSESAEWSVDACQKLRDLMDGRVKFELISKYKEFNYVKLCVGGRDIVKDLIFSGLAEQLEIINSGEICYISHINSLDDFFIQVDSDVEALRLIEQHLISASGFPPVDKPTKGTVCAALFTDDNYYRAQIIDEIPNENGIKVVFLDYGNRLRTNELRTLNSDISQLPHLRKRCCLKLPDNVQSWNKEAVQQFSILADAGRTEFTVKLVKPGKRAMVELFNGDENVAQKLGQLCEKKQVIDVIVDDHEHPIEKTPPAEKSLNLDGYTSGRHEGFISHVNSTNNLFIQLSSKNNELDIMAANLESAPDFEKIPYADANIGSVVAALYNDQLYYRAKVLDKNENGAIVFFIDYGNEWLSTDLRKLPDFLKTIEPLAVMVQLGEVMQRDLTESDHKQFLNLSSTDSETTFQIEFKDATSNMPTVHIWQDGRAIIEYLRRPRPINQTPNQYTATVDQIIDAAAKY